jgi:hypothetical protein
VGLALILVQVWFQPLGAELFTKIFFTLIIVFIACFVWEFFRKESKESKALRNYNELK